MKASRHENSPEPEARLSELLQAYLEVTQAFRDHLRDGSEWDEAAAASFLGKRQEILTLIEQLGARDRQPERQRGSPPASELHQQLALIARLEAEIRQSVTRRRCQLADQLRQLSQGRSALQGYRVAAGSGGGRAVDTRK